MDDSTVYIEMPDALVPITLPVDWTIVRKGDPVSVAGPESDLIVSFLARTFEEEIERLVRAAWQEIEPGFDLPFRQKVEMPTADGWDKTIQIAYDTPASESRMAFAIVRVLGSRAYISLIDGTKAAFSRRMAQIVELANAWKPAALKEPSLADITPKAFGEDEQKALSDFVASAAHHIGIPGVALALVQHGRTVYADGFGLCRGGENHPVTPNTRFMIGSSTKPLTTLMMARLVDMGRFAWTTPVIDVLPDFALADAEVTRKLEMRHTVCACTGMPRRDLDLLFRFRGVRPEDRIAEMRRMSPTTGLGETFQYSNYLVAAGGFAAAHSYAPDLPLGDAYDLAMRQLVFEPLGMQQTSVLCIDSAADAAPHGCDLDGNCVPIDPVLENFADAVAPAGSVWSTVLDMARYLSCELRNGLNDSGKAVVSPENLLARRRSAVKIDGKSSYGLGLMLTQQQGLTQVNHGGNTLGFSADMFFFPEHNIGMVVLTNLRAANLFLASIQQRLVEVLFGAESRAEAMVTGAKKAIDNALERARQRVKTDRASTAWISSFVGRFASEELGPACISPNGEGFRIEFESWFSDLGVEEQSSESRQIVLTSPPWLGDLRLQVSEDPNTLVLDGGQTRYKFVRVGESRS